MLSVPTLCSVASQADRWRMNWKIFGRKRFRPDKCTTATFTWRDRKSTDNLSQDTRVKFKPSALTVKLPVWRYGVVFSYVTPYGITWEFSRWMDNAIMDPKGTGTEDVDWFIRQSTSVSIKYIVTWLWLETRCGLVTGFIGHCHL
jgi:hypothetical protein